MGSINFSPFYRNPDNDSKIRVDNESSGIVKVVCSDDVLTGAGYRTVSAILSVFVLGLLVKLIVPNPPKKLEVVTTLIIAYNGSTYSLHHVGIV